jgi:transcriptional regulator
MYVPKHFNDDNFENQTRYIRAASFAALVTSVEGTPYASHLPFYFDPTKGPHGTLYAHVARANNHWKYFNIPHESLAIFTGPNAFITPNWYKSDNTVPTWNYVAVHAYGQPQIIKETDAVLHLLQNLNSTNENEITGKWTTDKMDQSSLLLMLKEIVAFKIHINRIIGKRKLSQNKTGENHQSSIDGLRTMNTPLSSAVANEMEADK